jgi:hypothetical protein
MLARLLLIVGLTGGGAVAAAEGSSEGSASVTLKVGETREVAVGLAMGLVCDDLSVVKAELRGGEQSNVLVLTGLKEGSTLCSAGQDRLGHKRLVNVKVTR